MVPNVRLEQCRDEQGGRWDLGMTVMLPKETLSGAEPSFTGASIHITVMNEAFDDAI